MLSSCLKFLVLWQILIISKVLLYLIMIFLKLWLLFKTFHIITFRVSFFAYEIQKFIVFFFRRFFFLLVVLFRHIEVKWKVLTYLIKQAKINFSLFSFNHTYTDNRQTDKQTVYWLIYSSLCQMVLLLIY